MQHTTPPEHWLAALHASSDRLNTAVVDLSDEALSRSSFADGWSISQVLSHLGSAAEICTALVERGLKGEPAGPQREDLLPVWARWDALPGPAQRAAWQEADARHLHLLDGLTDDQRESLRVPYFSGPLGIAEYAGYRLSEQSVHGWDITVALDPASTIPAQEVELLWQHLDLVATRFRDAETLARLGPRQFAVELTDPQRTLLLDLDAELHIYPCEPAEPAGVVSGAAEAVLRLVYGRNRPQDGVTVSGAATLDDLRSLFPGY
ncbi:maleylpyruvate isomerase family mycothiol-dependent enzyme [Streptomyces sp. NRRL S-813]|uniref:maleylpyruvate isomerase family mycothiol-dependent enzyme n=1 Tax=Streptomyces sp. NRRL S-813 TaxID=1463919 RepID=UPI0004BE5F7E|nr:maleylpyruvate isomerase family mycothiol-dependent enzyme [Streptomyces sp. NRRL S-813]